MKLRKLEKIMLDKGYASVRMVAAKLGRSHTTINRLIEEGELESSEVQGQKFVLLSSVVLYVGSEAARLLGLSGANAWKDLDEPRGAVLPLRRKEAT